MPDSDITIGELSRTIVAMDARINAQFAAVNHRLDGLQFVHRETFTVEMEALKDRVHELEEAKRWTARTFVAAFLFPILVAVILALAVAK